MAGRGQAPKDDRINHHDLVRGKPAAAKSVGWQFGAIPKVPEGLKPASKVAWNTWMKSWFAAFWRPSDLPGLRQLVRLYDQVERGEWVRASELRLMMDTYGVTPKGQQDRRWKPPVDGEPAKPKPKSGKYGPLRVAR